MTSLRKLCPPVLEAVKEILLFCLPRLHFKKWKWMRLQLLCRMHVFFVGVLSHLEKLEACAHEAVLKQGEKRQHEAKVARMKVRIRELRRQRDKLRTKLNVCRSQIIKDSRESHSQAPEISHRTLLEWKMENVKGLLQVFNLTGFSGKLTKRGARLCITTAFKGTYLDSYYLDLLIQQPIQIQHHSVPAFIPLEQIARKHLQADIKRFLSELSDHLNAYAMRKFQADQLQERFAAFLEGRLQGNSLFNLLEFTYSVTTEDKTFPFTAKLTYGDPVSAFPTNITVTCKENAPASLAEMAAVHLALFHEKPLHEVFSSITASAENLSQSIALELPAPSTSVPPGGSKIPSQASAV